MEDPQLVAEFVDRGSQPAFAALVERYADLVYSAALRQVRGNVHQAREIAQSVFADLARRAPALRERRTLAGWLYTSTRYAAVQVLRSEGRRLRREAEAHLMSELSSPDLPQVWDRLRPVLDDVMAQLSDDERESILLRYFEGRPFAEIGETFRVPENTARMRVERALDKMHGLLSRRGITSTTGALGLALTQQAIAASPVGLAAELTASALASTYAGAGALATAATSKATLLTVGAAALVGLGLCLASASRVASLRGEVRQLTEANRQVSAKLASERESLVRRTAVVEARARLVEVAGAPAPSTSSSPPTAERLRLILRTRAAMLPQYASLLRALRLPDATRIRLEALLLAKTVDEVTALTALAQKSAASGAALDDQRIFLTKTAAAAEAESRIAELLGPEKFALFLTYDRSRAIRRQVEDVARAARFTSEALSDAQVTRLVALIAAQGDRVLETGWEPSTGEAAARLDAVEQAALVRLQAVRAARRALIEANRAAAARGEVKLDPMTGLVLNEI